MAIALRLQHVNAARGVMWLRLAFRTFMQRPVGFSAMFASFLFAMLLSVFVPLLGSLLIVMVLPLLTLGFMIATRSALTSGPVHPGQLIEPLRKAGPQRGELLKLCVLYGLATVLFFLMCDWADGGAFEKLMSAVGHGETGRAEFERLASDPRVLLGLWLRALVAALLAIPFWHAPALVYWGGQGWAQALFSSTLACWRAKSAFIVYGLAWFGLLMGFGLVTTLIFALLGMPQLAGVAAMPAALLFSTVFYVSLYFTFADSFAPAE
jgi:hypothetical protein